MMLTFFEVLRVVLQNVLNLYLYLIHPSVDSDLIFLAGIFYMRDNRLSVPYSNEPMNTILSDY